MQYKSQKVEQLTVFLANRPGILADLCAHLSERGINIRAMSTLDILEMQANVNEIIEIGEMLSEYQKSLGIDNEKLQSALTNINVSMENLTEATEMISTTIDTIAEASPEATATQDMLRNELLAEIETEAAPAEKEEELEEKIREAQRE